jgi:hypothetical protein
MTDDEPPVRRYQREADDLEAEDERQTEAEPEPEVTSRPARPARKKSALETPSANSEGGASDLLRASMTLTPLMDLFVKFATTRYGHYTRNNPIEKYAAAHKVFYRFCQVGDYVFRAALMVLLLAVVTRGIFGWPGN